MRWRFPASFLTILVAASRLAATPPEPSRPPAGPAAFAIGRMLAAEGALGDAAAAFDEAVAAGPDDPYLRLEYAQLLVRTAQMAAVAPAAQQALAGAAAQAEAARRLAPEDPHVLRLLAQIRLAESDRSPSALDAAREALETLRRLDPGDLQSMLSLGQVYLAQGRAGEAADVLADALRRRPENRVITGLLVDALGRAGRGAEAEQLLGEVVRVHPEDLDSRTALADSLAERGDHAGAAALLEATPAARRDEPEIVRRLAVARYRTGDLGGALRAVDDVLRQDAGAPAARLLRALILAAQARHDEAAAELVRLRAERPASEEVGLALARVRTRQGRVEEAAELLADLARRLDEAGAGEGAARARLERGFVLLRAERWAAASEALGALREASPPTVRDEALLAWTDAATRLGRGDEALAALAAREAMDPAGAGPFVAKRAESLARLGRAAESREALAPLAESDDPERLLLAAEVHQRLEAYPESIPLLESTLARRPDSTEAAFRLGAAYEQSGRRAEALAVFRDLVRRLPEFAPALNYLGYMLAEKGEELDEAIRLVGHAVALDPDNGAYVDSLGWAHYQLGQFERAREYLERAAGLVPDDATVIEHLGDLYVAVGQVERARQAYRRALDLEAGNAEQLKRKLNGLRGGS